VVALFGSRQTSLISIAPIPLILIGLMPGHALLGAQYMAAPMIGMVATRWMPSPVKHGPRHIERRDPRCKSRRTLMTSWQIVRLVAGILILVSLVLGIPGSPIFVSQWWLAFTAFVGANLLQSALTKWCLLETMVRKLGARPGT
jgi:hypothetical protein